MQRRLTTPWLIYFEDSLTTCINGTNWLFREPRQPSTTIQRDLQIPIHRIQDIDPTIGVVYIWWFPLALLRPSSKVSRNTICTCWILDSGILRSDVTSRATFPMFAEKLKTSNANGITSSSIIKCRRVILGHRLIKIRLMWSSSRIPCFFFYLIKK